MTTETNGVANHPCKFCGKATERDDSFAKGDDVWHRAFAVGSVEWYAAQLAERDEAIAKQADHIVSLKTHLRGYGKHGNQEKPYCYACLADADDADEGDGCPLFRVTP